ncbi:MAG: 1,4-dihydroxy-2-naphthoate octaprenyltransferase [Gammaproteobacteria bacterium]|nr:1,4-dihydroxy-2-naphthoate octaprenyltransferase [Gammaproteobacteria bacterium]
MSPAPPDASQSTTPQLQAWWIGVRPKTLTLAVVPVVVGSAMAWHDGGAFSALPFAVTLVCALSIQAGTNLFNDVYDAARGTDAADRVGPTRITAAGLASPRQVKRGAWLAFGLAFIGGLYLVAVGGWPILLIGLASLTAGWAYSGGPRPLSHTAWGEVFVVVFFGLVAVGGSYYLQRGTLTSAALGVGLAMGLHAAAVLLVNNLRDHASDRRAGRRTLVHVTRPARAYWLYGLLLLGPFPLLALVLHPQGIGAAWLALPVCLWLAWRCTRLPPSRQMNSQLALTAFAQVLLGALLSITLLTGVTA